MAPLLARRELFEDFAVLVDHPTEPGLELVVSATGRDMLADRKPDGLGNRDLVDPRESLDLLRKAKVIVR